MTRKDYEAIAAALSSTRPVEPINEYQARREQWVKDRNTIAEVLAADNSRFSADRFFRATNGETLDAERPDVKPSKADLAAVKRIGIR